MVTFALAYRNNGVDPLAQLVEHNTFNVRVMGSSPMRVTNMVSINEAIFCCISNIYKTHTYNNHILCISQSNGKTAVIYRILPKSDTFVIQVCDTNLRKL